MITQEVFYKTLHHFFPSLREWFKAIPDPRDPNRITYSMEFLIWIGCLMYINKVGSRRAVTHRFKTPEFLKHLNYLSESKTETVAHSDTLSYSMCKIKPTGLEQLRTNMVKRLIRMRCLEQWRFLGTYWLIAFDGTGYLSFSQKHCDQCLWKETNSGAKVYYHPVLEAKLIFHNGLSISLASEFMDNRHGTAKQDCELKAFYRLTTRLKKIYPQLPICLSLDSLFANRPVMDLCEKYDWKYIIVFKEGSMPDVFGWYQTIKKLHPENRSTTRYEDGLVQNFAWVSPLNLKFHQIFYE